MLYDLKIFQKSYDFLLWVKPTVQRFAKVHKYSLGLQLENETIELLKGIIRANIKRENKKVFIEECFVHHETMKVLIRVAKDFRGSSGLTLKQYEFASRQLDEIGQLLGGWYRKFRS